MKELNIGRLDRIRLWQGDSPLSATEPADRPERGESTSVTLEWFGPRGGHFVYGLLGATLAKLDTPLAVRVALAANIPLAGIATPVDAMDELWTGLTPDFARSVEQAALIAAPHHLAGGLVVFDSAVHGRVGSSELVFSRLAVAVVQLLALGARSTTDNHLVTLLNGTLLASQ